MPKYTIKDYQKGFEKDQARIGVEVARNWMWPYAYGYQDLLRIHHQPGFDPETRHYCFVEDEMVGYLFSVVTPSESGTQQSARLDFPRMMPGHETAAELLISKAFATLRKKGVTHVKGYVTTMCPGDIELAENSGFTIYDWGFKVYYAYEMAYGKLHKSTDAAIDINPETELDDISKIASIWYKRSPEWCRSHLMEWHNAGIIAHVGVRNQRKWVSACLAARNDITPSKTALFYVVTQDSESLYPIVTTTVNRCVDTGGINILVADLINEHRAYETVYKDLGFIKVADWAQCEKIIT